jgi:hypothetical protein
MARDSEWLLWGREGISLLLLELLRHITPSPHSDLLWLFVLSLVLEGESTAPHMTASRSTSQDGAFVFDFYPNSFQSNAR